MEELLAEFRRWPNVTGLWDLSLAERDARFKSLWQPVRAAIDDARAQKRAGEFDASAAGFVWGGDIYRTDDKGAVSRAFMPIDTALSSRALPIGEAPRGEPVNDAATLARLHAVADLAPTATNWQPHRVLLLREEEALAQGVALADPAGVGLLFFRRPRYESLLGDILDLYGLQASAFEEWVDPGIYIETIRLAAEEQGLQLVLADAKDARPELAGATSIVAGGAIDARHLPFVFLRFRRVGAAKSGRFVELALSRSSQRVASPSRALSIAPLQEFTGPHTLWFESGHAIVTAIGHAMFAALYGQGADPQTKLGGQGGVVEKLALERAADHLRIAPEDGVAAEKIGVYLRERLLEGGRYQVKDGVLLSARGEAMTYKHLARMTKTFAGAMGGFFLQFHNTHPAIGIVLAAPGPSGAFDAGVSATRLLYHTRAHGFAAIVKSGPIDLAEAGIAQALAEVAPEKVARALRTGELRPALTVQVGWPLADETLGNGVLGLDQRERDLRPPRAHPLTHFFTS